jgi:hypothetical protein
MSIAWIGSQQAVCFYGSSIVYGVFIPSSNYLTMPSFLSDQTKLRCLKQQKCQNGEQHTWSTAQHEISHLLILLLLLAEELW